MTTIKFRRGTAAQWALRNPVLKAGEPGLNLDNRMLKIGDGIHTWSELGYLTGEGAPGPKGDKGDPGDNGTNGLDGKSAYELAVIAGFSGTIDQWLESLQGEPGPAGSDGVDGNDGADYTGPSITVSSTPPPSPSIGDIWIDTSA